MIRRLFSITTAISTALLALVLPLMVWSWCNNYSHGSPAHRIRVSRNFHATATPPGLLYCYSDDHDQPYLGSGIIGIVDKNGRTLPRELKKFGFAIPEDARASTVFIYFAYYKMQDPVGWGSPDWIKNVAPDYRAGKPIAWDPPYALWVCIVNLWYPFAAFAVLPACWLGCRLIKQHK
jgi:hypothetical protein